MIYQFRTGTRVPSGVTAGGVVTERDRIAERQGAVTVESAFDEIERNPGDYPNIRGFYPDAEEAWSIAAKSAIRKAFTSVVVVRQRADPGQGELRRVEVRWLHAPAGPSGEREYLPLDVIRQDPRKLADLLRSLDADASTYFRKFQNVMAELREALV